MAILSSGCDERVRSDESAQIPTAASAKNWLGLWRGPEGTFLDLAEVNGRYRITIRNLDGPRTFDGRDDKGGLTFERDGIQETLRAGSGPDTGMKWLTDKTDCLVVKFGEGYCRD